MFEITFYGFAASQIDLSDSKCPEMDRKRSEPVRHNGRQRATPKEVRGFTSLQRFVMTAVRVSDIFCGKVVLET